MSGLFEALRQQLRLYLASEKAPAEVLVIGHIDHVTEVHPHSLRTGAHFILTSGS